ncbi:glycosyltransferase [Calothrix sp. UHCC 0171]|uniref:glycosyltransferase n=1 Tax=Calothrix sp. UHCC 0171 TaxID=3110245 RepID=UPI002B21DB63|nr:glycosyltransferase [Calothrix sp. UHCC 0171]MEA5572435.1 glycosyltransferase [Calothrix sp. UHCC 0171]
MTVIELVLTFLSLVIWVVLLVGRGGFWRISPLLEELEEDAVRGRRGEEVEEDAMRGRCGEEVEEDAVRGRRGEGETQNFNVSASSSYSSLPTICAIIPARNEADLLPVTLTSLLSQDYAGNLTIFLVDDHSSDRTGEVAQLIAEGLQKTSQLQVINAETLPAGWSGKLWALEQGIRQASLLKPDYFLLTDADIQHDCSNLNRLVTKAVQENLDLASIMVKLRCESFWEKLLIPAFVFFFQKLYPFSWVNNPHKSTAAAAGGCILIRRQALERIGGIESIREALIDDCALAGAVKWGQGDAGIGGHEDRDIGGQGDAETRGHEDRDIGGHGDRGIGQGDAETRGHGDKGIFNFLISLSLRLPLTASPPRRVSPSSRLPLTTSPPHRVSPSPRLPLTASPPHRVSSSFPIWLGLSSQTKSLRAYNSLESIWNMVARTAFTQLNYSLFLLLATLMGMFVIYLASPGGFILGLVTGNWLVAGLGLWGWLLMSWAYYPTIRFYQCSPLFAFSLPIIGFLYTLMTFDSALRHWQGRGGAWKGRVYE